MKSTINESGDTAFIMDISEALSVMATDFSKSGTCNYFLTEDKILNTNSVLAFQVNRLIRTLFNNILGRCNMLYYRNKAPSWKK